MSAYLNKLLGSVILIGNIIIRHIYRRNIYTEYFDSDALIKYFHGNVP